MEISHKPAKFVYVLGEGAKTHDTVHQAPQRIYRQTHPILGDGNKVILFDYIKQPKGSLNRQECLNVIILENLPSKLASFVKCL